MPELRTAARDDAPYHAGPAAWPAAWDVRTERGVRSLNLWACVLPAAVMALLGMVAVVVVHTAGTATMARVVLLLAAAGAVLVLTGALLGAEAVTRRIHQRVDALRFVNARGHDDLHRLVDRVRSGERVEPPGPGAPPAGTDDPFALLAYDLARGHHLVQDAVLRLAAEAAAPARPDQRVEVFVNIARRMQSLVHREIGLLDELEARVEDPELLKGLFTIDHLATRMRRQSESLAVLGGASSRRQWTRPVNMYEVLRSAVAEVEHYPRVRVVPPVEGALEGSAVADVIHLVAELIENATKFSPPRSQVTVRAEGVTAGLAIEIDDRGLGILAADLQRMNAVLSDPGRVSIGELLRDGRIGLFVVSALARRHGVVVRLQPNVYGGTQAVVVLPVKLVSSVPQPPDARREPEAPAPGDADVRPPVAPAPAPVAVPERSEPAQAAPVPAGGEERPPLPQRQVQAHLAPQLRDAPAARSDEPEPELTPGLMAAFQEGVSRGEGEGDHDAGPDGTR